ncbi:hypothetical protein LMG23994_04503 [Cupriavidus pinatubonensis]|uniref:Phasin domain-containing protein n=2 Tax=Cupriavidus pinatubonensis TaxID=248026 RepID=A0ABM8XKT9_9BURK|nr:hypothetical protein LMG23994_04503 [Cupriavidus pinatubonensis]
MPILPTEPIEAAQAASLNAGIALSNQTVAGFQKLVELNLQALRATLTEAQEHSEKAVAAKNSQDLLALQANLMQPMCVRAQSYSRRINEIVSGVRAECTKVAETQYEANKRNMQDVIDSATKSAPAGTKAAVAAWRSAVSAATTLCDTMQQCARQAIDVAEGGWENAADATANAARQTSAPGSRAVRQ